MKVLFNIKFIPAQLLVLICFYLQVLNAADGFGWKTTGGAVGTEVVVKNADDLAAYAASSFPYVITISGTISLNNNLDISSDKTIQGQDTNAVVVGNLRIEKTENIIIQNLNITNPDGFGEGDGITVRGGKNIFITHCTFTDCSDGSIDIVQQADSITVSWCRFHYIRQTSHCYVNLIGNSDSRTDDLGYLHVTIHHCWYDINCVERMPSVRFGRVHVYNNYYNADSIKYGVRTRLFAECLVEGNYFENIKNPWELLTTTGTTGKLNASKNNITFMDTSFGVTWVSDWYQGQSLIPGTDAVFVPPYSYTLDPADEIKTKARQYAGNKGNTTGIEELQTTAGFLLCQNYPNPFNPRTKIEYSIPMESFVTLKVYDILGEEIAKLVNDRKSAGYYSVNFNGINLPSGIYFYRMQAENFISTKKLVLLK